MSKFVNGWIHGVIPSLFLSISVGQVYAFTNYASDISNYIGVSLSQVQFAFSLSIFFLGMGAAFFGKTVENNITKSTILGSAFFIIGLIITGIGILFKNVYSIYIGYGVLVGIGTGIIYISPVKTMMLWFDNYKAMASSVPIMIFGFGASLSTVLYSAFIKYGITYLFFNFALFYFFLMIFGILLLKKPYDENEKHTTSDIKFSYRDLLKNRFFIHSWIFMFLNIFAGLCLIPLSKQMMKLPSVDYSEVLIIIVICLAGILNGCGRFVFSLISDKIENRIEIIFYIISLSIVAVLIVTHHFLIGVGILIINACYGAGFSVIPAILSEKFGMSNISKIHGAVLSAWGIAGLIGNQAALFIANKLNLGYNGIIGLLFILYSMSFINYVFMKKYFKNRV